MLFVEVTELWEVFGLFVCGVFFFFHGAIFNQWRLSKLDIFLSLDSLVCKMRIISISTIQNCGEYSINGYSY